MNKKLINRRLNNRRLGVGLPTLNIKWIARNEMRQVCFRKRFVNLILNGTQIGTIKSYKKPLCVNDLFTPVVAYQLSPVGNGFSAKKVAICEPLTVKSVMNFRKTHTSIIVDGVGIYGRPLELVALNCGFTSVNDLLAFFPFEFNGHIYVWGAGR